MYYIVQYSLCSGHTEHHMGFTSQSDPARAHGVVAVTVTTGFEKRPKHPFSPPLMVCVNVVLPALSKPTTRRVYWPSGAAATRGPRPHAQRAPIVSRFW